MVCLGLEPRAAGWKAQTNPLSYGGTPKHMTNFNQRGGDYRAGMQQIFYSFKTNTKSIGICRFLRCVLLSNQNIVEVIKYSISLVLTN